MTMNYRSRTHRTFLGVPIRFATVLSIALTIALVFLFASVIVSVTGHSQNVFGGVVEYIQHMSQDKDELLREVENLKREQQLFETKRVIFEAHNRAYQDLIEQTLSVDTSTVVAPVIARPPFSPYDTYLLDTAHTVTRPHQLVISESQYTIGYTGLSIDGITKTTLFSYPGLETVVTIDGEQYRAVGQGGGVLAVQLPRSYAGVERKEVRISGVPNYILGYIETTEFNPQDSFVAGIVVLPANVYTQELVSISNQQYRKVDELVNTLYEEESDTQ